MLSSLLSAAREASTVSAEESVYSMRIGANPLGRSARGERRGGNASLLLARSAVVVVVASLFVPCREKSRGKRARLDSRRCFTQSMQNRTRVYHPNAVARREKVSLLATRVPLHRRARAPPVQYYEFFNTIEFRTRARGIPDWPESRVVFINSPLSLEELPHSSWQGDVTRTMIRIILQ